MKMATLLDDIHPGEILQAAVDLRRMQRKLAAKIVAADSCVSGGWWRDAQGQALA